MPRVTGLGHVGIYANDLMKQRDFYTRIMGLHITDEDIDGLGMVFRSCGAAFYEHKLMMLFIGPCAHENHAETVNIFIGDV